MNLIIKKGLYPNLIYSLITLFIITNIIFIFLLYLIHFLHSLIYIFIYIHQILDLKILLLNHKLHSFNLNIFFYYDLIIDLFIIVFKVCVNNIIMINL